MKALEAFKKTKTKKRQKTLHISRASKRPRRDENLQETLHPNRRDSRSGNISALKSSLGSLLDRPPSSEDWKRAPHPDCVLCFRIKNCKGTRSAQGIF
jgi:hypothetical protein